MRTVICRCLFTTLLTLVSAAVSAAEPAGIREPEQIVFEGVEKVAVPDIRMGLRTDFDAILAGHPEAPLSGYLRAIEATTLLGYSYAGFPGAKVAAEYDEQRQRIVVHVEEGPRKSCGDVRVIGAKHIDANALINEITQPGSRRSTAWVKVRPAPFDESTKNRICDELRDAFGNQSFFSPSFGVQIITEPNSEIATLEITINDEGPRAEIGEITIKGNERDSEAEILQHFDIRAGQRYYRGLTDRLKTRLTDSGRYLSAKIDAAASTETTDDGREIVPIKIELREYEQAPPLFEDFTAEEKALLAFRDWIHRWSRGETEHDIVVEISAGEAVVRRICDQNELTTPTAEDGGAITADLRIVIGPHRGQAIALWLKDTAGKPIYGQTAVLYPDRLLLGSPLRGVKLSLPQPRGKQMTFVTETKPAKESDEEGRLFQWMFGFTFKSKEHGDGTPLHVKATLDTAATLSYLHSEDMICELVGGVWKLRSGGEFPTECQIDEQTGRPIILEGKPIDEGSGEIEGRLTIRTEIQAWEREAAHIEMQLTAANVHDATSPGKALLEYVFDETTYIMQRSGQSAEKIAGVQSLRKLVSRWSPPSLAELWTPELSEIFGDSDGGDEEHQGFSLPWKPINWTAADFKASSPARRFLAAASLPVYRRLVPREGWLWPVGRDAILELATNSDIPSASLLKTAKTIAMGPTGELFIGSITKSISTSIAAQEGLQLLSTEGFRKDYQPLLSGDGWLSQWILSLAEAARSLDESELRSVAGLLPDDPLLKSLGASFLLTLKEDTQEPVANGLSRMLNVFWTLAGRDMVKKRLETLAPQPPSQPLLRWPNFNAEQINQQLKFLGLRSAEPTADASPEQKLPGINSSLGDDKPAENEPISIAEQINRLQKQQKK